LIRVVVLAKSAITRAGLASVVRADARFELVGEGPDLDLVRIHRGEYPQVVLLDSGDPALPLPAFLRQADAPTVVVLVDRANRNEVRRMLHGGIRAILLRESAAPEIHAALESAAAGLAVISPEILDALLPALSDFADADDLPVTEPLTSRESEIFSLLAEGAGNKEIASRLSISEHTVKFHVSSILAKLGAASRTEAVTRGYKEGLITM